MRDPAFAAPPPFRTRPDLAGTFGMTAATHWMATATAQSVLERGGNAFDAAVAAGFVLHLVEPHLNGPGGDLTAVFQRADEPGRPRVLMGQGPAPAGATVERFRAEGLGLVPGSGALAAAVPGAVDAWLLLLRDHGTWPLRDALSYAIGYARDGHPLLAGAVSTIEGVAELFRAHWPTSADRWMPGGRIPEPGELVRNPEYAAVLEALAAASERAAADADGAAPRADGAAPRGDGAAAGADTAVGAAAGDGAAAADGTAGATGGAPDDGGAASGAVPDGDADDGGPVPADGRGEGPRGSALGDGPAAAGCSARATGAASDDGDAAGGAADGGPVPSADGAADDGDPRPGAGPASRTGDPADPGSNRPDPSGIRGRSVVGDAGPSRESGIDAARARWHAIVGEAAEEFMRHPHRHADGADHAGVMTAADVAGFAASVEDAVTADFRGWTIAKTGPWGQGPVLLQALKILEGFDDERLDPSTELGIHTIAEALKLAFADREAWYGDGLDEEVLARLLSDAYAAERRGLIGEAASHEQRPGSVPGRAAPAVRPVRSDADVAGAGIGEPTVVVPRPDRAGATPTTAESTSTREAGSTASATAVRSSTAASGSASSTPDRPDRHGTGQAGSPVAGTSPLETDANGVTRGDTCHLDVVDRWGNMVSATPSGGWLQSSPTIPTLGFCLGTRLQMTWLDESSPSRLEPGKRPRTTLTPTLVLRDGEPTMALGSPGGDQQDQWQLLMLLRVLVGGYTPQQAIDAPALHTTSFPGSFWPRTGTPGGLVVEDRVGEDVIRALEARGHVVARSGGWTLGRLSAVTRDPATGILGAAANPRGAQGYAAGR